MSGPASFDTGIPVLTEVLQDVVPPTAPAMTPKKPAVWRTGAAATTPLPAPAPPAEIDLAVPAEAETDVETDPAAVTPAGYVDLVERAAPLVTPATVSEQPDDTAIAAFQQALGERILQQLIPRVDAMIAERLEQLLQGLAADLHAGLHESIVQAVATSVQQELASLPAQKK